MTNYHVYVDQTAAQAAADDMTLKYVPHVEELDLQGNPAAHAQVTQRWDVPQQRNDGQWIIQEYPGYVPTPPPVATEPYDPVWFAPKPVNTVPPSLSFMTASPGKAVSCIRGTWVSDPEPTYKYQWQADGVDINQAITSVHTVTLLDVGKVLTCVVTATNSNGSTLAVSNECNAIAKAGKRRRR